MYDDDEDFLFNNDGDDDYNDDYNDADDDAGEKAEDNSEVIELRKQIVKIHKKLTGEDPESVEHIEILQFLRIINYNFIVLTQLLQTILLKNAEMDTALLNIGLNVSHIDQQLTQFFETNSMLDETMEGNFNVSGSAPGKFI